MGEPSYDERYTVGCGDADDREPGIGEGREGSKGEAGAGCRSPMKGYDRGG